MNRTSLLATGNLAVSPLAALLLEALRGRATGVLEIEARGGTSQLYLRAGHPAGTQVFFGFRSLGHFLLELGWIDIDGLDRSLVAVARGQKQGRALVELGLLSEEQLHLGLVLHQQAQLRTLAALDEGVYRFIPGPELPEWTRDLRMSAHRAIVDALTAAPGRRVADGILARIPAGHGLVLRDGWERAAAQFELDAWEERFVARLVRPQRLEEAVASAPVPAEKARALAACFALMGLARPVPTPGGAAAPAARPADEERSIGFGKNVVTAPSPAAPLEAGTPGTGSWGVGFTPGPGAVPPTPGPGYGEGPPPEAVLGGFRLDDEAERRAREETERRAREETERRAREETERRAREEAERRAREDAERRARGEAERRSVDDTNRNPRGPAVARSGDDADGRARRARLLRRAFGNIPGAPEPFRSGAPAPAPEPAVDRPAPVTGPARPTPEPPAEAAPGQQPLAARLAAIRNRHRRIAEEDYFQRLGVPRTADRDQVKRAFFEAAKRFHPDRMPPELAPVARELKEIFTAINEAYEVLQDEERRRSYEAGLDGGAAAPTLDERLRALVNQAAQAMHRRAWAEAERTYRQAAALQERPDLLAHAAWAVLSDPARKGEAAKARTELAGLAASYPSTAAPHYYLGVIARAEGDDERAERYFRNALRANPKHPEAAQELRLLAGRKRRAGGKR
jgi:tetratricopeptide (TPR) repeat protein